MMNAMLSPNMTEVKRLRKARRKAEQEAERAELEAEELVDAPMGVDEATAEVVEEVQDEAAAEVVEEAAEVVEEVLVQDEAETVEATEETEGDDAQSQDA